MSSPLVPQIVGGRLIFVLRHFQPLIGNEWHPRSHCQPCMRYYRLHATSQEDHCCICPNTLGQVAPLRDCMQWGQIEGNLYLKTSQIDLISYAPSFGLEQMLSMNKLARHADSLRNLQAGASRTVHCHDDKTYKQPKPSPRLMCNECVTRNGELSSSDSDRTMLITLKPSSRS